MVLVAMHRSCMGHAWQSKVRRCRATLIPTVTPRLRRNSSLRVKWLSLREPCYARSDRIAEVYARADGFRDARGSWGCATRECHGNGALLPTGAGCTPMLRV